MRSFPIIPVWLMLIISIILIFIIIREKQLKKCIKPIIIVILLFLINLRIMIPNDNTVIQTNNLDVLFVIDNTISMNALDYANKTTRLYGVKEDCKYIIENLNGARFSVITFNNTSNILIPYTRDVDITIESIDIIEPLDELYAKGTSLNTPIDNMINSLKSSEKKDDRVRIVFFISDGEITNDSSLASYKDIKKYVDGGAVLGYGTSSGGYMKITDKYTNETTYILDPTDYKYKKAISKIDENNLKTIANDIGIEYMNMKEQKNITDKLNDIKKLATTDLSNEKIKSYNDIYYIFVIPLLVVFMLILKEHKNEKIY